MKGVWLLWQGFRLGGLPSWSGLNFKFKSAQGFCALSFFVGSIALLSWNYPDCGGGYRQWLPICLKCLRISVSIPWRQHWFPVALCQKYHSSAGPGSVIGIDKPQGIVLKPVYTIQTRQCVAQSLSNHIQEQKLYTGIQFQDWRKRESCLWWFKSHV